MTTLSIDCVTDSYIPPHKQGQALIRKFLKKKEDICMYPMYTLILAGKQARGKTARGTESCVVIIDQEDGNSTESLSL